VGDWLKQRRVFEAIGTALLKIPKLALCDFREPVVSLASLRRVET
jgi:ABC-type molybdate transport system ATPase subunit